MRANALAFLDQHGAEAHRLGWTAEQLFGIHPEHGLGGADEAERRVTASGIVEAIDVTGQRGDGLGSRLERGAPD